MNNDTWTYSHTQLEKHRLCPERYRLHYSERLLGDEAGIEAAWGLLVDGALSGWYESKRLPLTQLWFESEWEKIPAHLKAADKRYTFKLAQDVVENYVQQNAYMFDAYDVVAVQEKRLITALGNYITKPDIVLRSRLDSTITTLDIKTTTRHKPLLPYDDQQLGQAIGFEAQWMARHSLVLKWGKFKFNGWEWKYDVESVCTEHIAHWLNTQRHTIAAMHHAKLLASWPKHSSSCMAFGRPCPFIPICKDPNFDISIMPKRGEFNAT